MLNHVSHLLTPDLVKALCEMGHSDTIVLADANFPGAMIARAQGALLLRADGHGVPELLDAILELMPLDTYVDQPVRMMEKMPCDRDLDIPVLETYKRIVAHYDPQGRRPSAPMNASPSTRRRKKPFASCKPGKLRSTPT